MNNSQLKTQLNVVPHPATTVSFKSGFERRNDCFNYGGMTVDRKKVQRMISRSLKKRAIGRIIETIGRYGERIYSLLLHRLLRNI